MTSRNIIPFLDVILSMLMVFICIVMLMRITKSNTEAAFQQQAIYLVVMQWQGNDDMDLWARDPVGRLVGFNRREGGEGSLFSLNRDNLGARVTEVDEEGNVTTALNEEIVGIRGTFEGEYCINGMVYSKREPTPTTVTMRLFKVKPYTELMTKTFTLERAGDEHTFFRFVVDKEGAVTEFSELPVSLFPSPTPASVQ